MSAPHHPAAAIDLNCDLGESDEPDRIDADERLLGIVTSASIACTGHAGDERSMTRTIGAAMARGVAIGAHPSYPDRAGFGRVAMDLPLPELEDSVARQIGALVRIARGLGATVVHVKPHGALYHAAMTTPEIADVVAAAAHSIDPLLALVGQAGSPALRRWSSSGFRVIAEAFADRRYESDGSLTPRSRPGALIESESDAAAQAVSISLQKSVVASGALRVPVHAETICLHSDTPGAPTLAKAIRVALERAGVAIRPPTG